MNNETSLSPEYLYDEAMIELENTNYTEASEKFKEIETKYPLSNEAIQSQIMLAFINYLNMDYENAILKLDRIINKYPSYKEIDYVYYMKGINYYEQIENPELDSKYNQLSLESFQQLINRFPNSKYSNDSRQKIILLKENLAAKNMNIAMFYLKQKKYLAALNRYNIVVNDHNQSKYVPEALHRLVEIYYTLGMVEEANKAAAVLGYNYPDSKWYKYSYKILVKTKKEESFLKNLLNKISKNNNE
tara:strand:- start:8299 stop:9036 length:738 start_codon:yes stop_codon:yes gene_type:complete